MSLILLPVSWNWIMRIFCFRLILSGLKSIDTQWFLVKFSLVINDNLFNFVIMFHVMTTASWCTTDYMCYIVAFGFCNIHARIRGGGGLRDKCDDGRGRGARPISSNFALEIDILFLWGRGVPRSSNVNRSRR